MRTNYYSAVLLFSLSVAAPLSAQAKYTITDLFSGNEYHYINVQEQLKDHKWNFYEEIFIQYPVLTDTIQAPIQDRLNKRFKNILHHQLETDSFRINLFEHLSQSLATYLKVNGKPGDELGTYKDNKYKFTPDLESVNFHFLACHNAVVTFVADFEYTTKFQHHDIKEHLHYYQVFYFNLENGMEFRPADVFKKTSEKELNKRIEEAARKDAEHINFVNEGDDLFEYTEDPARFRNKELIDFELKDGFAYPKAFSMAFYINRWTPCTENLNGYALEIRFSFEEIKMHLNPKGPFASLIRFQEYVATPYKNQNNPLFVSQHPWSLPFFIPKEFSPFLEHGKLKTVSVFHVEGNKNVLQWQTEYLQSGYIKEMRYYQNEKLSSVLAFTFDSSHNLIKKATLKKGVLEKSEDYTYDKNGNLLCFIETNNKSFPLRTYYYYADTLSLVEHYGKRTYKGGFAIDYTYKLLDKNGRVKDVTVYTASSSPYRYLMKYGKNNKLLLQYEKMQLPLDGHVYVYDTLGRLMTHEHDKGRYLSEFKYDANNNLVEEIHYDGQGISRIKKAEYNAQNRLIQFSIADRYNSINIYVVEYEYW